MAEFLAMGGYGGFVWPAYGLTAMVMLLLLIASLQGRRKAQDTLAHLDPERDETGS